MDGQNDNAKRLASLLKEVAADEGIHQTRSKSWTFERSRSHAKAQSKAGKTMTENEIAKEVVDAAYRRN